MSVFYSYSTNRETTRDTYIKISEKLPNLIIDVDRNDKQNSSQLLTKIINHIESASVFVCDVTPDISCEQLEYPSPNVMLELGYALKHFSSNNIILLLNTYITSTVPSMLQGFVIQKYDTTENDYLEDIIDIIQESMDSIGTDKYWLSFDYQLNNKYIELLSIICKTEIKSFLVRYNKKLKKSVILLYYSNNKFYKINIQNKTLHMNQKIIDLCDFDNLYNELKHIELLINLYYQ